MSAITSRFASIRELKAASPVGFGIFLLFASLAFVYAVTASMPWLLQAPVVEAAMPAPDERGRGPASVPDESGDAVMPPPVPSDEAGEEMMEADESPLGGAARTRGAGGFAGYFEGVDGVLLAILFCIGAAVISALVLFIALPVFLFANGVRANRAGGLVRTTLGFFVTSASALLGTITLAR